VLKTGPPSAATAGFFVSLRHCEERSDEAIQTCCAGATSGLLRFARNDVAPIARQRKLCGSTSTSSLRLPLGLGPAASHCRKYSDRSKPRADLSSRRKR